MKIEELQIILKDAKAVIFDVDGTILDSMPIWQECDDIFLRSKGKDPDPNLHDILFPMTLEEGMTYLKTTYELQESTDEIARAIQEIVADAYRYEIPAKEGMVELIHFLHDQGTRLLIATSNERKPVQDAMRRLGLDACFADMLFCTEVGAGKGTPLIFQRAAEVLKTDYPDIYLVEDGLYSMKTAKELGMKIIGIYDQACIQDQPEIRQLADYYVAG
ncbi:MAG: HAD family phosphatase [Blautia sp.]|nr:HAD family phosphatase [Blautia sp.]